jgi:DNA-binding MarR family transcriptional regulator
LYDLGDTFPPPSDDAGEPVESPEAVLASPMSSRLLAAARARPGLTLTEARDALCTSWGSLYRHLVRLQKANLVRLQTVGRRRLLFPVGEVDVAVKPSVMEAVAFLRQPTARLIAVAIVLHPGQSVPDIARSLDLTARVVYHHVQRLLQMGLIHSSSQTRHRDLAPTQLLFDALEAAGSQTRIVGTRL